MKIIEEAVPCRQKYVRTTRKTSATIIMNRTYGAAKAVDRESINLCILGGEGERISRGEDAGRGEERKDRRGEEEREE